MIFFAYRDVLNRVLIRVDLPSPDSPVAEGHERGQREVISTSVILTMRLADYHASELEACRGVERPVV